MMVGGSLAARDGAIDWWWLGVTGVALFCMEVAKNAWGDVYDYDSGTDLAVEPADRTPFSGGKRVLVDRLLTRGQTWTLAFGFGGIGAALGAYLVFARAPEALWVGAVGLALGWSYHGPPLKLAYRGLGELSVGVTYGPLIACGTYVVQRGYVGADVLYASIPLGLVIMAFLWINEVPDRRADALAGKRTLVVRLGEHHAAMGFTAVMILAFAGVVALVPLGLPTTIWLGLIALPLAAAANQRVHRFVASTHRDMKAIIPAQGWTLIAFVLMAIGLGAGVLLG